MGMRVPSVLHPVSNGARGGLTAFVSTIAGEQAAYNVTMNNLLPGPFDTDRMKVMAAFSAEAAGHSYEDEIALRVKDNPARRYGRPEEMGALCAFLCSDFAGYITGQTF